MGYRRLVAITTMLIGINASCASNSTTAKPAAPAPSGGGAAAAPAPAARPTPPPVAQPTPPPAAPAGGPPGGPPGAGGPPGGGGFPGGGRGRVQLTPEQVAARRDSLTTMRAAVMKDLLTRIAGSESKRAADEFTNVTLMKDSTSANFLKQMDYYGRSLSVGCMFCHVDGGKWDDDSKEEKRTTRIMIQLVDMINTQGLSKMPGQRPPRISCVTCHRGRTSPGQTLLPQ